MPNELLYQLKQDILELKMRVTILENKMAELGHVPTPEGTAPSNVGTSEGEPMVDYGAGRDFFSRYRETGTDALGKSGMDLVKATYTIRQAGVAIRGYAMLIDQMGLSRDQKKMIKEIEAITMAVIKLITAIRVARLMQLTLSGAIAGGPLMAGFYGFAVSGELAHTIAYSNKATGGGI